MKTQAEYQREYRRRKKERAQKAPENLDAYLATPFNEWMGDKWSEIHQILEWMGVKELPDYVADGDTDPDKSPDDLDRKSIGRAERMVSFFISGGIELAGFINRYKLEQIDARLAEIEVAELSDADARKKAMADVAKLTKFRDELNKDVRWTFPQWKVTGE